MSLAANVLVQAGPALASPTPSKATKIGFEGSAFGTEVNIGNTVESGRSALSTLGCTDAIPVTRTNTLASVNALFLNTGTINTSAASETNANGVASSSMTTVQGVSLLGGLVAATAVTSEATTGRDNATGTFSNTAAGTQFLGLTIAGVPVTVTPMPNQKITIPGVGYVELNEQSGRVGANKAQLTVIGLHVVVTLSTPLAPVGTQIIVSDASSGLGGPFNGLLSGLAYGASANVANTVIAGRLFPQPLGCFGTNGVTRTNTGAAVNIPGIVTTGTVTDTAEGINNRKQSSAETSSTIQNLNLLGGTVSAIAVRADVTAAGNPPTLGDNSNFLGLAVAGFPQLTDNVLPNTKLSLAGIGTLWLHRVFKTANTIHVIMIQLIVTAAGNPLGLPLGTTVNIASASVGVS